MRSLPPPSDGPEGAEPSFDSGLPAEADEVLARGDEALRDIRKRPVDGWVAVGAALKTLQLYAMRRSNSNQPIGRRYAAVYRILEHPWPELTRIDPKSRTDAIWVFESADLVRPWLATLTQNERDRWTHPTTIRRHYEKRHPSLVPTRNPRSKERPPRNARGRDRRPLGEWTRTDLERYVVDLEDQRDDRDRENIDLMDQLEERDRTIAQLQNDLRWEQTGAAQLRRIVTPPAAAQDVRESREIVPPVQVGKPHYAGWAQLMTEQMAMTDVVDELVWLQDDNREHIAAFEAETPGAGRGIEQRIGERMLQLQTFATGTLAVTQAANTISAAGNVGRA